MKNPNNIKECWNCKWCGGTNEKPPLFGPPPDNMEYERNHSHTHCWLQDQPSACNIPLEKHKQCCLCDTPYSDNMECNCVCAGDFGSAHCKCACHENKLKKPYEHETKCCENMNGATECCSAHKVVPFKNSFQERIDAYNQAKKDGTLDEKYPVITTVKKILSFPTESLKGWEEEFDSLYIKVTENNNADYERSKIMQKLFDDVFQKEKRVIKEFIKDLLSRVKEEAYTEGTKEAYDADIELVLTEARQSLLKDILEEINKLREENCSHCDADDVLFLLKTKIIEKMK